jgi:hypothetical protein
MDDFYLQFFCQERTLIRSIFSLSLGYMTTTQIIFLFVVQDTGTTIVIDETIQRLCITLHRYYVEYILNPFTPITTSTKMIESKQFHNKVQEYINSYNNNIHTVVR